VGKVVDGGGEGGGCWGAETRRPAESLGGLGLRGGKDLVRRTSP